MKEIFEREITATKTTSPIDGRELFISFQGDFGGGTTVHLSEKEVKKLVTLLKGMGY